MNTIIYILLELKNQDVYWLKIYIFSWLVLFNFNLLTFNF